jgi:hypothetical protein
MLARALSLFCLVIATAAAEPNYDLRVNKEGWGGASHADLSKVLRSSCDAIAKYIGEPALGEPIRARHDKGGPITLFKRNVRGEIVVELSSKDTFWCQHAYQMAHEFCHILCEFREGGRQNLWFEETLCELASIFAVRAMAETWKTDPPYPNWKDYSKALREYAADLEKKYALPKGTSLSAYVADHLDHLRANPTDRGKNGTVAVALLPLFEAEPDTAWAAVRHLNAGRGKDNLEFREHLKNWHDQAPEDLRPFINEVAKQLLPARGGDARALAP